MKIPLPTVLLLLVFSSGAALTGVPAHAGFKSVTGPCQLVFPEDHGPHPAYRTEWWYYTGNVAGVDGHRFGFQLTFFRSGMAPPGERQHWPTPASAWRSNQLYLAHAALTDVGGRRHHQAERMLRPVRGLAGAQWRGEAMALHLSDWRITIGARGHQLVADTGDFSLTLDLVPLKSPVLHGDGGYSRKGTAPERASCYYSFTRLKASGDIRVARTHHKVTGSAWMDHEFSTAPLEPGLIGWDWFSIQLNDGTEVMIYLLRQADGSRHPASSGTFVTASGETRHLSIDDIHMTPLKHWKSPRSNGRYPIAWRLAIAALDVKLNLSAVLADQEMRTQGSTGVTYWEGSLVIDGIRRGEPVDGVGYGELTGYAETFDAPM